MSSLAERIRERAHALGFVRCAFVRAQRLPHADSHFEWIREGRHGLMSWIERYGELRNDPSVLEPGTKTVISVATIYHTGPDLLDGGMRIARYAQGDDYHDVLRARLLELAAFVHAETGSDIGARPAVDSAPLLERDVAALAGLGWIGKNTMLIDAKIGSYTFLSELLVNFEIEDTAVVAPDRCGTCTRCIDVCPTGAIVAPYVLDARRCISYLTIELRGPIPRELRPLIGDHLFGCDLCQDVCPWNSKAQRVEDAAFVPRDTYQAMTIEALLGLDQTAFSRVFSKSAVKRTKRSGLLRNAAVVLGNRKDPALLPLFQDRLAVEPDPLVRGHLVWAMGQLGRLAEVALHAAQENEVEPFVLDEIKHALESLDG